MNSTAYDLIFRNLQIIDGTGAPSFRGDIGIKGDMIVSLGTIPDKASREIDCEGLTAAPGFIDIHNHSDVSIFQSPEAKNYTTQGVTTLVVGNCGISSAPVSENLNDLFGVSLENTEWDVMQWNTFSDYIRDLKKLNKALNVASFVGHGNIRDAVIGMEDKPVTPEDLERMKGLAKEAMESGAFGMSSGLIFDPGLYAKTHELTELCKVIADYGGVYTSHIRNESDLLIDAIMEAITIGRNSGVRVEISHLKTSGKRNFGLLKTVLKLMEYYRRFGVEITGDAYPCIFGQTGLENCFPAWTRSEGQDRFVEIVKEEAHWEKIKHELMRPSIEWENILLDAGFDQTFVAGSEKFKEYDGKSISEISRILRKDPYETVFQLVANEPEMSVLVGGLGQEDMEYALQHDLCMICSDAGVTELGEDMCHPRSYRAFTKVLSKYVREDKLLTLEQAIRKMTSLPAWKLNMTDRGLIRPGMKADLAIFDFWNLNYTSEYGDPHHYSEGMGYVFVNGRPVIFQGNFTDEMPGAALKKSG